MRWLPVLSLSLLLSGAAGATTLSLSPAAVAAGVGDSFSLSLVLADLGGASVGGFDLDVAFDAARLALVDVTLGAALGGESLGEALLDVLQSSGSVNLAAVSLLAPDALDALQGDPVVLATLEFQATSAGAAAITLEGALVSDALAGEIAIDTLEGAGVQVPEPGWLAVAALAMLLSLRRRASRLP